MSALAYRISIILFHSGVSHQDLIRLNRLGVCMTPDMIIKIQYELGRNFDADVLFWKKCLEGRPHATLALLNEIKEKQVPKLEEDDMQLEVQIDISQEALSDYENYSEDAVLHCNQMCAVAQKENDLDSITPEVLNEVIEKYIHKRKYPYYKYVFMYLSISIQDAFISCFILIHV
jgi:hypothetical protein